MNENRPRQIGQFGIIAFRMSVFSMTMTWDCVAGSHPADCDDIDRVDFCRAMPQQAIVNPPVEAPISAPFCRQHQSGNVAEHNQLFRRRGSQTATLADLDLGVITDQGACFGNYFAVHANTAAPDEFGRRAPTSR